METITIPKRITRSGDLVVIPRKHYEALIEIAEKKELDAGLQKALEDYRKGKYYGPFQSVQEGRRFLGSRHSRH